MNKIIDFHQHTAQSLKINMHIAEKYNIEKAIVMPFPFFDLDNVFSEKFPSELVMEDIKEDKNWLTPRQVLEMAGMTEKPPEYFRYILDRLTDSNEELIVDIVTDDLTKEKLIPVPWISLGRENIDIPIVDSEFLGYDYEISIIKFIPVFDSVTKSYYKRMSVAIDLIGAEIVMIHTGWGSTIPPLLPIIEAHPEKMFVLAHMKEDLDHYNFDRIDALKKFDNVYLETSYVPHSKRISQYVSAGYGDRLLFGSDFRTLSDEQSLRGFIRVIEEADISPKDRDNILYNNAHNLLKSIGVVDGQTAEN